MAHWFDDLSRRTALKTSRRGVLKVLAVGVASLVLPPLRESQAQSVTYPAGWNLVGGPDGAHLLGATGPLYTLQRGDTDYEQLAQGSALKGCSGYWAYFPSGGSLDATGSTQHAGCFVIPDAGAWVMVGNATTNPVSISGAQTAYTYTPAGGYAAAMSIPVGQGAWVAAANRVDLVSPVASAPTPSPAPVATPAPAGPPTALCTDGTFDYGAPNYDTTCAGHGGVATWYRFPPDTSGGGAGSSGGSGGGGGGSGCCRHCTTGCPCGNSCITCRDTCHTPGGCAC